MSIYLDIFNYKLESINTTQNRWWICYKHISFVSNTIRMIIVRLIIKKRIIHVIIVKCGSFIQSYEICMGFRKNFSFHFCMMNHKLMACIRIFDRYYWGQFNLYELNCIQLNSVRTVCVHNFRRSYLLFVRLGQYAMLLQL